MSQQMQTIPVSNQVQQLTAQLHQKVLEKLAVDARAEQLDEEIKALRNLLAGVGLGQQLQQEIAAASANAEDSKQ